MATPEPPQPVATQPNGDGFAFLVAACHWPDDRHRQQVIADAAAQVSDWARTIEDARRHRILPLVASAFKALDPPDIVPAPVRTAVNTAAARDTLRTMVQLRELVRLGTAFDRQGLDWITFKGPALGVQAYGDLGVKSSHDLDILIRANTRNAAYKILSHLGYVSHDGQDRVRPGVLDHVLKDSVWHHPTSGVIVELHVRLFINRALVPQLGMDSPREQVAMTASHHLPSFARAELLVYLAVHGGYTNWYRLKWIADFAALLGRTCAEDQAAAHVRALDLGVRDIYDSALLITANLFRTARHTPPRTTSAQSQRLATAAVRELTAQHHATLREADWDRTFVTYSDRLRFRKNWAYRREELRLMVVEASSYTPDAPWWRPWTAPMALGLRYGRRKLGQMPAALRQRVQRAIKRDPMT